YDVVILDPAKMTRDREQVIPALKKYLDMNKLAISVVKPGGLFATFSCTGLVSEEQFLDMLRRAAFYSNRTVQVLKVAGAGPDHPFLAQVQESRYLKAVFGRVLDGEPPGFVGATLVATRTSTGKGGSRLTSLRRRPDVLAATASGRPGRSRRDGADIHWPHEHHDPACPRDGGAAGRHRAAGPAAAAPGLTDGRPGTRRRA